MVNKYVSMYCVDFVRAISTEAAHKIICTAVPNELATRFEGNLTLKMKVTARSRSKFKRLLFHLCNIFTYKIPFLTLLVVKGNAILNNTPLYWVKSIYYFA